VVDRDKEHSRYIWGTDRGKSLDRWEWILRDSAGETFGLRVPQFSIFDPDGNLPLNLQRTELTHSHLDFMPDAFEAQAKSAFALLLKSVPEVPTLNDDFINAIRSMFRDEEILPLFLTRSGAGLLTQRNLLEAKVRNCLMVGMEQRRNPQLDTIQRKYDATIFFKEFDPSDYEHDRNPPDPIDSVPGTILSVREIGVGGYSSRRGDEESSEWDSSIFATDDCPPTRLTKKDRSMLSEAISWSGSKPPHLIAAEVYLGPSHFPTTKPLRSLAQLWTAIMKEPVIPFDPEERGSKLSHAYGTLGEYLADFAGPERKRYKRRKR
jgi:hypothetical protein